MQDVFVIDALRTPFGSFGGAIADVSAPRLATLCIGGGEAVAVVFERVDQL